MSDRPVERRLVRRETHSSRAGAAILVAVLLALALLALGAGSVALVAAHPGPTPPAGLTLAGFDDARGALLGGGIVALVVGVVVVVLGVAPGRRHRHRVPSSRLVVLVADEVVADEVADRVSAGLGLERRQVRVLVGRGRATVRVAPTSGVPVDLPLAQREADEAARALGVAGGARVVVVDRGVVGR